MDLNKESFYIWVDDSWQTRDFFGWKDIFGCLQLGLLCKEATDADINVYGTPPCTTNNYLPLDVNSAEVEKSCSRQTYTKYFTLYDFLPYSYFALILPSSHLSLLKLCDALSSQFKCLFFAWKLQISVVGKFNQDHRPPLGSVYFNTRPFLKYNYNYVIFNTYKTLCLTYM